MEILVFTAPRTQAQRVFQWEALPFVKVFKANIAFNLKSKPLAGTV